ncbi:IS110 family transposase [Pedobacter borealis]|uniref:IS110 family transposase n=1 Tax=Pedobacter borealis TaxID=475254 RepID=UPI0005675BE7|nr:IS110 family transposase [Pedobacter borealis]
MKNILKQVAGIDVAKKELVVCLSFLDENLSVGIISHQVFSNNKKGFEAMVRWVTKQTGKETKVRYVMEATGVYHEALAYFLTDKELEVSIVLPNKISNFFRTLEINTITDKTASQAIARFGLERKLEVWKKPKDTFRQLKQLTRERDQMVADRTVLKNQLHAERSEAFPNQSSIKRINKRIALINKQEEEIKLEVAVMVKKDRELCDKIEKIATIPGVGKLTAVIVLAETNGFELIKNTKQLVSYSGLDVKVKDSGTSVKGKPKISKKGNRHIRKAMHMPALSAIRYNEKHKALFTRLISKHGIRMKAVVAVQRKILELIYIIYKTDLPFDQEYAKGENKTQKQILEQPL